MDVRVFENDINMVHVGNGVILERLGRTYWEDIFRIEIHNLPGSQGRNASLRFGVNQVWKERKKPGPRDENRLQRSRKVSQMAQRTVVRGESPCTLGSFPLKAGRNPNCPEVI